MHGEAAHQANPEGAGSPDLGQEIDYEIAAAVIGSSPGALVVDIGVEHGSFVEVALRAGAARVIGFEPLPRHVEYLARRFAAPTVDIRPIAISSRSGTARLHVATDADGRELDYHHTLSDLGDSATVIRSRRAIEVRTAALADLVRSGSLPAAIDFLKIDTDGHDLAVLEGLGEVRPRAIMAEYWDTLPETSGTAAYGLADLCAWGRAHGYRRSIVVRRNGLCEVVQYDAPWSVPGDWGNVLFLRDDFPLEAVEPELAGHMRRHYDALRARMQALAADAEAKEAAIHVLHDAAVERAAALEEKESAIRQLHAGLASHAAALAEKDELIARLQQESPAGQRFVELEAELQAKEAVIRELSQALSRYRAAFSYLRFLIVPAGAAGAMARRAARALRFSSLRAALSARVRRMLAPGLGNLNQHAPRALRLPPPYRMATPAERAPRISLVTPSYGQAAFIERTLRSVLDQGYPRLEYFVQDGGSADGTVEVLRRYGERLSGWSSEADSGQSQAINRGFARTSGEIMAWLNSDDVLLPGALACVADFFVAHPEVDVVYGHRVLIDEQDREIGRWRLPAHDDRVLSWADFVPQETLFWRRRIWDRVDGRVDESFRFAMDWDLILRFRDAGARFARIDRALGGFRIHERQKTSAAISDVGFREMDRLRERALGRVPSSEEVRRALMPYLLRHVAGEKWARLRSAFGSGT